ncbi:Protein OrgB [Chromobacterium vaccinii]|nr:Protein OrgB [Chromobacterium vaccinii]QND90933.1 Protein OrgB [Chromobacterium vaccinii]
MQEDIPLPHQPTITDGVLIRSPQLRRLRRIDNLDQQARKRARQHLDDAQREADAIRRHAYRDGYQQGMLAALDQLAAHLANSQAQAERWREQLSEEARAMLAAAVDHPDTLLLLLDEWLRSRNGLSGDAALYLLLPKRSRPLQAGLMALLADNWHGTIQIDYHDDDRFIMRCADQAAEFSPQQYLEPASRQLLQRFSALQQECRQLSAAALERFQQQLSQRLSAQIADAAPSHRNDDHQDSLA